MRVEMDGDRVVKSAESDGERMRLRHEAAALRACAHPGVVSLVSVEAGDLPGRLVMTRVPGGTLEQFRVPFEVMAGVVAALAVTVADLHDIGWTHGAIRADHVLLDARGGPVLAGFGQARSQVGGNELAARRTQDVAALAALLRPALSARADRNLRRLLAPPGERSRLSRPVPARQLAARIVEFVPAARLQPPGDPVPDAPSGAGPDHSSGRRPLRVSRRAAVTAGLAGLAGAGLVTAVLYHPGPAASARRPVAVAGPGAAPSPPAGRYLLAGPSDTRLVTVTGRWSCGIPRPAALDPGTGWVWMFDAWPDPGRSVSARPVAHLPGASGLAVQEVSSGCDRLVVLARSGAPQVVAGPGRAGVP